jgi:hypothetical protein
MLQIIEDFAGRIADLVADNRRVDGNLPVLAKGAAASAFFA